MAADDFEQDPEIPVKKSGTKQLIILVVLLIVLAGGIAYSIKGMKDITPPDLSKMKRQGTDEDRAKREAQTMDNLKKAMPQVIDRAMHQPKNKDGKTSVSMESLSKAAKNMKDLKIK